MSGLEGLLTGRTLVKRYVVREVIGRGGFAAVYRADDERLGRPVAVKVITYPAPDAEMREHLRERFQREARALASLPQHPNLVTVHDFGIDPELGLDFLVMELLHGENLAAHLDARGRPHLESALRILREAAEGLCIGHRAGMVHRDVKPANIFLARASDDGHPRICVLDFGIAQVVADGAASTRLTRTGLMPHSPAYASPEQLRGTTELTPAADVFSLGVVGYQLLTGEKPFSSEPRTDPSAWTPPRSIRELNPEVPPEVEAVLQRAMAVDPAARYPDAGEMAAALDDALRDPIAPVVAAAAPTAAAAVEDDRTLLHPLPPPPPPPAAAARPVRASAEGRRGPPWVLAAVLLVLLAAVGVWALSGGDGEAEEGVLARDTLSVPMAVEEEESGAPAATEEATPPSPAGGAAAQPAAGAPAAPAAGSAQAPVAGSVGAAGSATTPVVAAPSPAASGQPGATRPAPTQPATAQPVPPAQPAQPAQPQSAPAQPAPAQPPAAAPDTTRPAPRLLGRPVERRPAPDSTRARRDTTETVGAR